MNFFSIFASYEKKIKNHTEGGRTISIGIIIYYYIYVPLFEETREF